jgi:hypothetical protein
MKEKKRETQWKCKNEKKKKKEKKETNEEGEDKISCISTTCCSLVKRGVFFSFICWQLCVCVKRAEETLEK